MLCACWGCDPVHVVKDGSVGFSKQSVPHEAKRVGAFEMDEQLSERSFCSSSPVSNSHSEIVPTIYLSASTSLGLFAWETLVLISKGHSRRLLNQDLFCSKWPHWWPTIASHKEKLEAAIDTNGDQFFTARFTVTTIYPCLQWSYKQRKRNVSIHYVSLLPFL